MTPSCAALVNRPCCTGLSWLLMLPWSEKEAVRPHRQFPFVNVSFTNRIELQGKFSEIAL